MATVAHAFAREARRVHGIPGLTETDIARATGAAPSTARAWLAGTLAQGEFRVVARVISSLEDASFS
jgi:hypothetical protein